MGHLLGHSGDAEGSHCHTAGKKKATVVWAWWSACQYCQSREAAGLGELA